MTTESDRWNLETFNSFKGVPWQPIPGRGIGISIKSRVYIPTGEVSKPTQGEPKEIKYRRIKRTKRDLEKYGYTHGCRGCENQRSGGKVPMNHNEECRKRVEEKLTEAEDPMIERINEQWPNMLKKMTERE